MTIRNFSEDEAWVICRSAVTENYKILRSIFGRDIYSRPYQNTNLSKRDFLAETQTAIAKRFFLDNDEASEFCKIFIQNKKNWQDYLSKENLVSLFLLQNKAISIALKNSRLPYIIADKIAVLDDREFLATPIARHAKIKGLAGIKKNLKKDLSRVETYRHVMMPIVEWIGKWYHIESHADPFGYLQKRFGKLTTADFCKLINLTELGIDLNGNLISKGVDGTLYVNDEPLPDGYVIDFGMESKTCFEQDDDMATDYSSEGLTFGGEELSTKATQIVDNFAKNKNSKKLKEGSTVRSENNFEEVCDELSPEK